MNEPTVTTNTQPEDRVCITCRYDGTRNGVCLSHGAKHLARRTQRRVRPEVGCPYYEPKAMLSADMERMMREGRIAREICGG